MLKPPGKGPWRALAVIAAVTLALLAAIFLIRRPGDPAVFPAKPGEAAVTIYLVDNGYHTNIAVPTERLRAHGGLSGAALAALGPAPWTEFGWGDERFYIQTGVSGGRAVDGLRAMFAPNNPSAVMLGPLRDAPDRIWSSGVTRVELSQAGFERMLAGIDRSFVVRAGAPVPLPGGADGVRFFKSREYFSILHICNHWTSERLNGAGIAVRPVLDTFPAGLLFDLETEGATVHRSGTAKPRPH